MREFCIKPWVIVLRECENYYKVSAKRGDSMMLQKTETALFGSREEALDYILTTYAERREDGIQDD